MSSSTALESRAVMACSRSRSRVAVVAWLAIDHRPRGVDARKASGSSVTVGRGASTDFRSWLRTSHWLLVRPPLSHQRSSSWWSRGSRPSSSHGFGASLSLAEVVKRSPSADAGLSLTICWSSSVSKTLR